MKPHGHGQHRHASAPAQAARPEPQAGHAHHGSVVDPNAAAAMEREMFRRFLVALALSLPIVWLSGHLPGLASPLPHSGHAAHALLFALTTPVVFYEAAARLVTFVLFGHWVEMRRW